MAFSDWSTVADDNGTTLGVNIAENCTPGNVNNAIRKAMADVRAAIDPALAAFLASTSLASARTALGVTAGSTSLTNLANLTNIANKVPVMSGSDNWTLGDLFPTGGVICVAMNSAPSGWLECDGAAVSRTTYSALFALIGTTHGTGDGSTTFNVPDLRGYFVRGWDHARGIDSGRTFGSTQDDAFEAHTHTVSAGTSGSGLESGQGGTASSFTSGSTGGTETRPKNVALMYVIKT